MEDNELRIGSIVKSKKFNKYITLELADFAEADKHADGSGSTEWFEIHLIPIPLTEEWLVKLGFFDMNDKDVQVFCYGWNHNGEDFEDAICITKDADGNWCFSLNRKVIVSFVHELQNIIYALIKQELTIKG